MSETASATSSAIGSQPALCVGIRLRATVAFGVTVGLTVAGVIEERWQLLGVEAVGAPGEAAWDLAHPHLLGKRSSLLYLVPAPWALFPVPSLALVIGFALAAGGLRARAWSLALAAAGASALLLLAWLPERKLAGQARTAGER